MRTLVVKIAELKYKCAGIVVFVSLVCLCTSCKEAHKQNLSSSISTPTLPPAIGGTKWLSLSPDERNQYVAGYLNGYDFGFDDGCDLVQKLELRYSPEEKNQTVEPSYRCFKSRPEYSKAKWLDTGNLDVSYYSAMITELYEKHPDARSAAFMLLLGLMHDGGPTNSEQLYAAQLNKWPNARVE